MSEYCRGQTEIDVSCHLWDFPGGLGCSVIRGRGVCVVEGPEFLGRLGDHGLFVQGLGSVHEPDVAFWEVAR